MCQVCSLYAPHVGLLWHARVHPTHCRMLTASEANCRYCNHADLSPRHAPLLLGRVCPHCHGHQLGILCDSCLHAQCDSGDAPLPCSQHQGLHTRCCRHDQHGGRNSGHHWCRDHGRHPGPDGVLAAGAVCAVHLLLRDRCRLLWLRPPQHLILHGQDAWHTARAVCIWPSGTC